MAFLPLSNGEQAEVDDELVSVLSNFTWHKMVAGKGYASTTIRRKCVYLHRFIMGLAFSGGHSLSVDHIDGNGLNNKRSNLRICTHSENMLNKQIFRTNKSGFKGVSFCKASNRYSAQIKHLDTRKNLGFFKSPEDAAKAYDKAAKLLHGEFARLNFPDEVSA